METYLKFKEGSKAYNNVLEYDNNIKTWRKVVKQFADEFGIEAKEFYVSKVLGICDMTENDLAKYESQLKKDKEWFKKSSKLAKRFEELIKENGLTEESRLRLIIWDFNIHDVYGRHSTQKFEYNGDWYLKVISDYEFEIPEDYDVIKGSEWHKMLEESCDKE